MKSTINMLPLSVEPMTKFDRSVFMSLATNRYSYEQAPHIFGEKQADNANLFCAYLANKTLYPLTSILRNADGKGVGLVVAQAYSDVTEVCIILAAPRYFSRVDFESILNAEELDGHKIVFIAKSFELQLAIINKFCNVIKHGNEFLYVAED